MQISAIKNIATNSISTKGGASVNCKNVLVCACQDNSEKLLSASECIANSNKGMINFKGYRSYDEQMKDLIRDRDFYIRMAELNSFGSDELYDKRMNQARQKQEEIDRLEAEKRADDEENREILGLIDYFKDNSYSYPDRLKRQDGLWHARMADDLKMLGAEKAYKEHLEEAKRIQSEIENGM